MKINNPISPLKVILCRIKKEYPIGTEYRWGNINNGNYLKVLEHKFKLEEDKQVIKVWAQEFHNNEWLEPCFMDIFDGQYIITHPIKIIDKNLL